MKKITYSYLFLVLFFAISASAQNPVTWTFSTTTTTTKGEFVLSLKANIQKGWYLYSQNIKTQPPMPTTVTFDKDDSKYTLLGAVTENGKATDEYDEENKQTIRKYSNYVVFEARVKSKAEIAQIIGNVRYMTCNDSRCLPPKTVPFNFNLFNTPAVVSNNNYEIKSSKKYASDSYISSDERLNLNDEEPIDVNEVNKKRKSVTMPTNSTHETVNIEKTGNLVGANVLRFMPKPKPAPKKLAMAKPLPKKELPPPAVVDPVAWQFNLVPTTEKGIYKVQLTANVVPNWYLYAQTNEGDIPVATKFRFEESANIEWLDNGTITENGTLINTEDKVFKKSTNRYANTVVFERTVKFKQSVPIYGSVSFMAADDNRYNMPQEQTFELNGDNTAIPIPDRSAASLFGILALILASGLLYGWLNRSKKMKVVK
jgi:hypothetical protein